MLLPAMEAIPTTHLMVLTLIVTLKPAGFLQCLEFPEILTAEQWVEQSMPIHQAVL